MTIQAEANKRLGVNETLFSCKLRVQKRAWRMFHTMVPGAFVRHPTQPDWGLGQVQSVDGSRITVNFENAGKHLINGEVIELSIAGDEATYE